MLFLFGLFSVWLVLCLVLPVTSQRDILAPQGEGDRLFFGGNVTLSQEFIPHGGFSSIEIPLGSEINSDVSLLLHIRSSVTAEDIAVASLFSFHEGSARFDFSPIWRVPEKLIWVIEAPHAPAKSFWVYREQDASAFSEGKMYQNKRLLRGNIGFSEIWKHPRIVPFLKYKTFSPQFADFEYMSLLGGFFTVILFLLSLCFSVQERKIVFVCIAVGILLRIWLGLTTPIIIDEGAYIQDVLQSSGELLPFRDFLTKGPAYLFFLWLWSFIVPNTVIAWRLFSIIAWACGGYALWQLMTEWELKKKSRIFSVVAWNLMPASVALTTPLLLQVLSVSTSLFGLLLVMRAIHKDSWRLVVCSAFVLTLACLMRITSIIPSAIGFLMYLLYAMPGKRIRLAGTYVATGILLFLTLFGSVALFIGPQKAAVVMNAEAFLISRSRQERSQAAEEKEPLVRTLTIESRLLWRTGVLLIVPLLLFPLLFVHNRKFGIAVVLLGSMVFIGYEVLINLQDTSFLLPKKLHSTIFLIYALFIGAPFITAIASLLYGEAGQLKKYWNTWKVPVLVFLWLVLTIFAYSKWGRFRQSYLSEFLPQLVIIFGVTFHFMLDLWQRIKPKWFAQSITTVFIFFSGMIMYQGYMIAYQYPHTGTIDQNSLVKITRLLQAHVPQHETIFTAQPVATAFARRSVLFGYSHPGWYREARFGTISEVLRDLLFKKPEYITEYLRSESNFVLYESRTHEIYFDGYPERVEILGKYFEKVDSVLNETAGDTYTLYKRR